jgi:hypothetical protein
LKNIFKIPFLELNGFSLILLFESGKGKQILHNGTQAIRILLDILDGAQKPPDLLRVVDKGENDIE